MDKARASAAQNGKIQRQRRAGNTPRDEQIKTLISKPCVIRWSDGSESRAAIGDIFYTEEAYDRYRAYKESGNHTP